MKGEENNFIIKFGKVPERIIAVGYYIDKGEQYPLVFGNNDECVGVVLEHYNHENKLMGKLKFFSMISITMNIISGIECIIMVIKTESVFVTKTYC